MTILPAMERDFKPEQWFEKKLRVRFGPHHGWINLACAELGVTRQAFRYWRLKGIPKDRAKQVREVCKA